MHLFRLLPFLFGLAVVGFATIQPAPARNLFSELLGKSETEIDAKVDAAWRHFFTGDAANERIYYPVGEDRAYIADVGNGDVRSEGMSYGMMIAVQRDRRAAGPVLPNQFTLEGKALSSESSTGLIAMAAVAGLAADTELARPFVQQLWDAPIPVRQWRYYDGLLYFLGLLQASGRFQIFPPSSP